MRARNLSAAPSTRVAAQQSQHSLDRSECRQTRLCPDDRTECLTSDETTASQEDVEYDSPPCAQRLV